MDLVNQFNAELSSLYDTKPPISKGKMTSVTKAALKAVKYYKHVVQSVEKFIQKCKAEYKIPGLYVIDSIIRQSRHQFGSDKDIFAGRFARNLQSTFSYLYKCPEEDKSKVIRVLNLWQKNKIFLSEAIQPLFDLADPNHPLWEAIQKQEAAAAAAAAAVNNNNSNNGGNSGSGMQAPLPPLLSSDQVQFKKELLDYDYEEDDGDGDRDRDRDRNNSQHQSQHQQHAPPPPSITSSSSHQNDYSQNNLSAGFDALGSILTNPEVLRQLQTLQEQMAAAAVQQQQHLMLTPEQERQRKLAELNKQEAAFDQRLAQTVSRLPLAMEFGFSDDKSNSPRKENVGYLQPLGIDQNSNQLSNHQQQQSSVLLPPPFFQQLSQEHLRGQHSANERGEGLGPGNSNLTILPTQNPFGIPLPFPMGVPGTFQQHNQAQDQSQNMGMYNAHHQMQDSNNPFAQFNQPPPSLFDQSNFIDDKDRDRRDRRKRRSRSIDRHRPKSRSPSLNKIRRRSRSNSRNRNRKRYNRSRSKSRDRKEDRERERERQRKGFPPAKKEHLSVCSTTLWVGHLSRQVAQEEISDTFGAYGDVISIDLIAPRGCAFVVMNRRQDACRALDRLKNMKLQSKTITLAWAPGKGVKGRDWKDYWEVDAGVSYIPWIKLNLDTDLEEFEDGGCVDEDTLPDYLRNKPKTVKSEKGPSTPVKDGESSQSTTEPTSNTSTISAPATDQAIKTGDIDVRQELASLGPQNPTPIGPPPMVNATFGLAASVGMMTPMGLNVNMMMPPPMLGMGVPPQFSPMGFPMMGLMQPAGLNHVLQQQPDLSQMKPGLLGEMPMPHLQQLNHNPAIAGGNIGGGNPGIEDDMMGEDNRKRHPDKRENRDRKRSRFDDSHNRNSPPRDMDEESPQPFNERSLQERLKNLAEGYGFAGKVEDLKNSLIGSPIGPLRPPMDRMPTPHGFPSPHLPRGVGQFPGPRQPWLDNRDGPRTPWFDKGQSQNPFINPGQNPFVGNPFVQNSENPFELGNAGPHGGHVSGPGPRPEPGQFFGQNPRGGGGDPFNDRGGGWSRDGGGPPPSWRGDRGGRGGRPARGGIRGSSRGSSENWQQRRGGGGGGGGNWPRRRSIHADENWDSINDKPNFQNIHSRSTTTTDMDIMDNNSDSINNDKHQNVAPRSSTNNVAVDENWDSVNNDEQAFQDIQESANRDDHGVVVDENWDSGINDEQNFQNTQESSTTTDIENMDNNSESINEKEQNVAQIIQDERSNNVALDEQEQEHWDSTINDDEQNFQNIQESSTTNTELELEHMDNNSDSINIDKSDFFEQQNVAQSIQESTNSGVVVDENCS